MLHFSANALFASLQACVHVFLICGFGVLLCHRGMLDKASRKTLSTLCKNLFLPALLIAKVGPTISAHAFLLWWPLPVFALTYIAVGLIAGWVLGKVLGLDKDMCNFVSVACAFPNTTSIPLALLSSILPLVALNTVGGGTSAGLQAQGATYILFYTLFMQMMRWGVAFPLLAPTGSVDGTGGGEGAMDEESHLLNGTTAAVAPLDYTKDSASTSDSSGPKEDSDSSASSASEDTKSLFSLVVEKMMNAPVYAALLTITIGLVPPLKALFFAVKTSGTSSHSLPLFGPSVTTALVCSYLCE